MDALSEADRRLEPRRAGASGGDRRRVLVIGLDGATFRLLDDWMNRGVTPHLRQLAGEGTRAVLRSVVPPVTAPAWTSFATGARPGRHGVLDFWKREPGTLRPRLVGARDMLVPPVWDYLIDAGQRVGLINVPVSYPAPAEASFAISDLMTPSSAPRFTQPPNLFEALRPQLGDYVIEPPALESSSRGAARRMLDGVEHLTRQQARYAEHLMKTRDWDFCMVVFMATDWLQHRLWDVLSGEHITHPDTPGTRALRKRTEEVLSALDACVGELVSAAPVDTDVFLVSDHGFGALRLLFKVNLWLARAGLLAYSRPRPLRRLLGRLDVLRLRRRLRQMLRRGKGKPAPSVWRWIDWEHTVAYSVTRSDMGIRVNLRGWEPLGVVPPGAEYEQVRERVLAGLRELRHPETGETIVTEAFKREDLFQGPGLDDAPDLIYAVDDGACAPDLRRDGPIFERTSSRTWTGTHRLDGILVARGPRIQRARRLEQVEIIDIAPTLLHLFGLPAPDHMEGRIPDGLLTPEARAAAPWRELSGRCETAARQSDDQGYTEEQTRQVEERLRDLGYL